MTTIETTRRALLARSAAVAAAIPAAAVTAQAGLPAAALGHPDAELLVLGRKLDAHLAIEGAEARDDYDDDDAQWEEIVRASDARTRVYKEIIVIPAQTIEGLHVKVRAIELDSHIMTGGAVEPEEWLSLTNDIRRLAGKAVQS